MSIITNAICDGCFMTSGKDFSRQEIGELLEWVCSIGEREDIPECPCIVIAHHLLYGEEEREEFLSGSK